MVISHVVISHDYTSWLLSTWL